MTYIVSNYFLFTFWNGVFIVYLHFSFVLFLSKKYGACQLMLLIYPYDCKTENPSIWQQIEFWCELTQSEYVASCFIRKMLANIFSATGIYHPTH